jgi:N4-gp56 family major capsid protein
MTAPQTYSDISPRTQAFAMVPLLKRHTERMILQKLGQVYTLPTKSSTIGKWRRYEALSLALTALVEGVTPAGQKPTFTDYSATLEEHGDFIPYTGFMLDTHEDPILKEYGSICVQQAAETLETLIYNKVKAGTNVGYANGSSRDDVNTPITLAMQRTATAALIRQRGEYITDMVSANPDFRTEPVEAAFVAAVHSDVTNDVRKMEGFISTKQYQGGIIPWANEIGAVEDVRYVRSTLFTPWLGGTGVGGTKGAMRAIGDNTNADVYPVLYFSKDAFGMMPLKGSNAMSLIAHNPGSAGSADALNQKGTLGWKMAQQSVILNQLWLYRLEVAVTA